MQVQHLESHLDRLQVRSHVEKQIDLIAQGLAGREAVVAHTLDQFARKFRYFVGKIQRMDALFEASFSPLASSGEAPLPHVCPPPSGEVEDIEVRLHMRWIMCTH